MRRTAIILPGLLILLTLGAMAQENRSEISLQGTGFFTRDTNGQGVSRTTTNAGGVLVGYRYHFNRWISGEANYGFDHDTQRYFSTGGLSRVQSDVHAATADLVVNLPFTIRRFNPYVLGGGGSLVFRPTGNAGGFVPGADTQARGTFLYGGGTGVMCTRTPISESRISTLTSGPTRRNHPLESFSGFRRFQGSRVPHRQLTDGDSRCE